LLFLIDTFSFRAVFLNHCAWPNARSSVSVLPSFSVAMSLYLYLSLFLRLYLCLGLSRSFSSSSSLSHFFPVPIFA
jgi:hypothetical protein